MIKLEASKTKGLKDHFIIKADEPVTVEVTNSKKGGILAQVYRGQHPTEYDEPVGAYDSYLENDTFSWEDPDPSAPKKKRMIGLQNEEFDFVISAENEYMLHFSNTVLTLSKERYEALTGDIDEEEENNE